MDQGSQMDVAAWLRSLGLDRYERAFRENEVDARSLPHLTSDDLKELGVAAVGHRRLLLHSISEFPVSSKPDGDLRAPASAPTDDGVSSAVAERRHLTVLLVDLVGSTALSSKLDPEDMHALIGTYQNAVTAEIEHFDGHVAKYMGDGVLAYFGWPKAHEDDAERAVRADLAAIRTVREIGTPDGRQLAAHAGIASGLVVVGDLVGEGPAQEEAVVGETPNLAARLQALAEPGRVAIAESTRRLIGDVFELVDLGTERVKGIDKPVQVFLVNRERKLESRFEAHAGPDLLPMVGRDHELDLLLDRWELAKAGEGQGALLIGEAGIGKSRIVRAVLDAVAKEPHVRIRYQCSPFHRDSALWPVTQQLGYAAGFRDDDPAETKLYKLEALLSCPHGDATALIGGLLGLDTEERCGVLDLAPQERRSRTMQALGDELIALASTKPVLVVLEDAHWIDPTTLELMEQFLDRISASCILVLLTSRVDNQPALSAHPNVTVLALNRLGHAPAGIIVDRLGGTKLGGQVTEAIIARGDGIPLFVEELTKAVLQTGKTSIPDSLHDSLMARLDRLPEAKDVAQIAACIGREFPHSLLSAVSDRTDTALNAALEELAGAELIYRRGRPPDAHYGFKHALLRDAAYQSLLKSRRQQLHASLLNAFDRGIAPTQPEILAHHAREAGQTDRAIDLLIDAGEQAVTKSAMIEATAHFRAALALLDATSKQEARPRREMRLQAGLARALATTEGYSAPEAGAAFARAADLCRELEDNTSLTPMLYGQFMFHLNCGDIEPAHRVAVEQVALAERTGDTQAHLIGTRAIGTTAMWRGSFSDARVHQERSLELFDPDRERRQLGSFSHDPLVSILSNLAWILLALGYPEQALARSEAAVAEARRLNHPVSLAVALHRSCQYRHLARDLEAVRGRVDELKQLADAHDLPFFRAFAFAFAGSLKQASSEFAAAEGLIRNAIDIFDRTRITLLRPYVESQLAEALIAEGRTGDALTILDDAQSDTERSGARWFEAEIWRLRAVALQISGRNADAAGSAERAILVARQQQARLWELRAATVLARHLAEEGKHGRAQALLAPIYGWFTEGLDTKDFIEAKALLDGLR